MNKGEARSRLTVDSRHNHVPPDRHCVLRAQLPCSPRQITAFSRGLTRNVAWMRSEVNRSKLLAEVLDQTEGFCCAIYFALFHSEIDLKLC